MTVRIVVAVLISLLACSCATTASRPPESKSAKITRLLELTGSLKLGSQMAHQMSAEFVRVIHSANPRIPQQLLDVIPEEINQLFDEHAGEMTPLIAAVYDRYYTEDDIDHLLDFYSTDTGKKLIATAPAVSQECMRAGMQWGQALGPEIERRLKARFRRDNFDLPATGT